MGSEKFKKAVDEALENYQHGSCRPGSARLPEQRPWRLLAAQNIPDTHEQLTNRWKDG